MGVDALVELLDEAAGGVESQVLLMAIGLALSPAYFWLADAEERPVRART
ncbi:hypothetical protein [Streptomyces klenkii]